MGDKLVDIGEIEEKIRETVRLVLLVEARGPLSLFVHSEHHTITLYR